MNVELSKIKATYCENLRSHKNQIDEAFNNPSVSVNQFNQLVRNIIITTNDKAITDKSQATKRFLSSLDRSRSKVSTYTLVFNSILAGDGLSVI